MLAMLTELFPTRSWWWDRDDDPTLVGPATLAAAPALLGGGCLSRRDDGWSLVAPSPPALWLSCCTAAAGTDGIGRRTSSGAELSSFFVTLHLIPAPHAFWVIDTNNATHAQTISCTLQLCRIGVVKLPRA
jgi:hypothetical protein